MVSLMMMLVSDDQNVMLFWPKECNGAVDNTTAMFTVVVPMVSYDQKGHVASYVDNPDLIKCNSAIDNGFQINDTDTNVVSSHDINANDIL